MLIRLTEVLRDIARGGLAGAFTGFLVGGLGGRVVMSVAAVLNPDATGFRTENGELIGAFTLNGTLALMLFGGLGGGIVLGLLWVIAQPWLPAAPKRRILIAMPMTVGLVGMLLVRSTNTDFSLLDREPAIIAMFLALIAFAGAAVAWLDARLDARMPRAGSRAWPLLIVYGAIGVAGLAFLPTVANLYLTSDGCGCATPPVLMGWALVGVGGVTLVWWILRISRSRTEPPAALVTAGGIGLLAATGLGTVQLANDALRILGLD
ncbi:MAG: hypothetical protein ABI573_07880 [Chloroflexota bacterium]